MNGTPRTLAILRLPAQVPLLIEYVDLVITKMTGNPFFPSPTPTLATVSTAVDKLRISQVMARGRGVGLVTARDGDQRALTEIVQDLRGYVQQIANANPGEAASVIESAGMFVRKTTARTVVDFAVTRGAVSGSAHARVKSRGPRATYWWEYSLDQKTWRAAPVTQKASASFEGLTAATLYYFRYQVLTSAGLGDWSQVVSLTVL